MTTTSQLETVEFAVVMAREFPDVRPGQLVDLMRLAKRHGRLCERLCNEPDDDGRLNKAADRLSRQISHLCKEIGCTPAFSGDPRGVTVKIKVPSGYTNDFGSTGVCVPQ